MKTAEEILEDVDDLLAKFEDYTHGKDGEAITKLRGEISQFKADVSESGQSVLKRAIRKINEGHYGSAKNLIKIVINSEPSPLKPISESKGETGELFAENLNPYSPHCKWITPDFYNITGKHICDIIESDKPTEAKTKLIFNQFSSLRSSEPEREGKPPIRSLSDKQKEVLKMFDAGYGMRKEGEQLYMYTNTDKKIPIDFELDIKPLHEMKLIKDHRTMLDFVYLNLNEDGKMAYKQAGPKEISPSPPLKPLSEEHERKQLLYDMVRFIRINHRYCEPDGWKDENGEGKTFTDRDILDKFCKSDFYPIPSVKEKGENNG